MPQPPKAFNRLIIDQWTLPIAYDPKQAWQLLETDGIDFHTLKDYRDNHIRLGVLDASQAKRFTQYLKPMPVVTYQYPLSKVMRPTFTTPFYPDKTGVRIKLPPDPPNAMRLPRGQFQFLAKLKTVNRNNKTLRLIPHHAHETKRLLHTPSLLEKNLQGKTFEELTLDVQLREGKALIVSFITPKAGELFEPIEKPEDETDPKKTQATGSPAANLAKPNGSTPIKQDAVKNSETAKKPAPTESKTQPTVIKTDKLPENDQELEKLLSEHGLLPSKFKIRRIGNNKDKQKQAQAKQETKRKKPVIEITSEMKKQMRDFELMRKSEQIAKQTSLTMGSKLLVGKTLGQYTQTLLVIWIQPVKGD